jgi:propanediol dehydratase small subunit
VKTSTNKTLDELTLESVLDGKITAQDMRITPETLRIRRLSPKMRARPAGDELRARRGTDRRTG